MTPREEWPYVPDEADDPANDPGPPVDPMSMLEVVAESYDQFLRKQELALRVMADEAIRAIVSGADPQEVASACGYRRKRPSKSFFDDDFVHTPMGTMPAGVAQVFGLSPRSSNGLQSFAEFLTKRLTDLVMEVDDDG